MAGLARIRTSTRFLSDKLSSSGAKYNQGIVFKGREKWKNWINFDSSYKGISDQLNRKRHYFWLVDLKGRLWREDLEAPGKTFGQMRESKILDYFFAHIEPNCTGEYEKDYPYLSRRLHECYFVRAMDSPIVFTDILDGSLAYGDSLREPLHLTKLCVSDDGRLYHPIVTQAMAETDADQPPLLGLVEATTAQSLLADCTVEDSGSYMLHYGGQTLALKQI